MRYVIAISGPVAVGKSRVLQELENRFSATRVSTRQLILARTTVPEERGALQAAGERLDRETAGSWVADDVEKRVRDLPADAIVLVDAVRIAAQVEHLRAKFGEKVWHVHLTASEAVLAQRYLTRPPQLREFGTYQELRNSGTEAAISELAKVADVCILTDTGQPASIAVRAVAGLALYPSRTEKLVDVIVGAQYGSEGKGNVCAYLAKEYDVLMRVGGPNAGHRVADPPYDWVQLPSGTGSNTKAQILIGAGATIWRPTILQEIRDHSLSPKRLAIDPQAMIIEQSDRDREGAKGDAIGSTKKGVGFATARKIVGRFDSEALGSPVRLAKDVPELQPFLRETKLELERAYADGSHIMLEGTQGTALSLHHGPYPHVTSRETTASGCLADAGISPLRVRKVILITRTYPIRVGGDSGLMPAGDIDVETIAQRSDVPVHEIRKTEVGTVSGKPRRIGEMDWELIRWSAVLNGASEIVLTFADYLSIENRRARTFEDLTSATRAFVSELEKVTNVPVSIISTGFGPQYMIDRRAKP